MTLIPEVGMPRSVMPGTKTNPLSSDENKPGLLQQVLANQAYQKKKQEWGNWVEGEYIKCKNARSNHERQWYLNLAFVNGRHYVSPVNISGQGFRLTSPKQPPHRVRLVINKVRVAVRTECSKLSAQKPIPVVVPATGEEQDYAAAKVAEQLLKTRFSFSDFNHTYRSWIWWGVVCGTSFLKTYWAPNETDDDLMNPAQSAVGSGGQPLTDTSGNPIIKQEPVKGKIMIERVTPFHIYVPDLLAEDIEDQPYVIHAMTRTPEWVKSRFDFNATPDAMASNTIMESAFLINKNSEQILNAVVVKEIWIKPNGHKDFPTGGMLTVINGKVIQCVEDWPWPFTDYPFYKYDGIPTGGFYGDSIVVDLIPLQKEYNRTKSQMVEIKNTMQKPRFVFPRGSINLRQISSEPGQGIPYTPGFEKPDILPGVEIPQTMSMELDRLNSDFDDISGQHEITRGNTPAQVTSGTAIAFLQEQDDSKLAYQVASIEAAVEKLGKHYLRYVATYWGDERLIRIVGKDNNFEAIQWKGSDLRGNTDVRVQAGSALPFSRAAKQAMVTELMQSGFLDPTSGMEIMQLGGLDKVLDEMLIDKRQAQRENLKMSQLDPEGIMQWQQQRAAMEEIDPENNPLEPVLPVNSWDNHEAHIMYHNNYRKTQEFELLDDLVKQEFELHIQMHQVAATSPQMGAFGTVANDPTAPVTDPETGTQVPNPLQPELPLDNNTPVGPDGNPVPDLSGVDQTFKMQREEEKHNIDMRAKAAQMELQQRLANYKMQQQSKPKTT